MIRGLKTALAVTLVAAIAACNAPSANLGPAGPLVTAGPASTATATPFAPLPQTPTPLPTAPFTPTPSAMPTPVNPWGDFPAPVEPSAIEIPRPMEAIRFPEGVVNVILLGSDQRPYEAGHRTDTMMIASLNPQAGTVTLLSIPRDLYVYIPGWRVDRINIADLRGGPDLVAQTILYNLGIRIDHWARVNFYGFVKAVDALGGIDVQVTRYLRDECGGTWYTFWAGTTVHMSGWTALCYVRMRKTSGDFDRLRRQQEVIQATFNRVVSLDGLSRVPELYAQFGSLVQTDLSLEDVLPLVPLAVAVSTNSPAIRHYAIDSTMATQWRVPYSGAAVLLPNRDAIQAMLRTTFGS
ncbi:MAG: LCP family protein [Chloroflexota bacterium]